MDSESGLELRGAQTENLEIFSSICLPEINQIVDLSHSFWSTSE